MTNRSVWVSVPGAMVLLEEIWVPGVATTGGGYFTWRIAAVSGGW